MASSPPYAEFTGSLPTETIEGKHNSLMMYMSGLGSKPASGRLLRGLTPFLDQRGTLHVILLTERQRREPWSGTDEIVPYQEIVHWARDRDGGHYRGVSIKGDSIPKGDIVQAFEREPLGVVEWVARRAQCAIVSSDSPLELVPCEIPKPWGREYWYSGIEARGVSMVRSKTGTTELPYALGLFPTPVIGDQDTPPILLKILEPHADPNFGDLYLEVHREKWEAYIVLDVAADAWPGEAGKMRAGLAPEVVQRFQGSHGAQWERAVIAELGDAIAAYETVRREIDGLFQAGIERSGRDPLVPQSLDEYRALHELLPDELKQRERAAREGVDAFLGHAAMPEGQVAMLPPGALHSLRHGVTVVEFQTPNYERLVAMSSQKVLTQNHWDTREALALMSKTPYEHPLAEILEQEEGLTVERVVDFPQFQVARVHLAPGVLQTNTTLPEGGYHLIFVLSGSGVIRPGQGDALNLEPRSALLLGAAMGDYTVQGTDGAGIVYLIAQPKPTQSGADQS